jgi:cytochrome c oxidase assembly factor CtaG
VHTIAVVSAAWRWHRDAIAACAVIFVGYCFITRLRDWRKLLWFFSGLALLAAILCSPMDLLARDYLFTAEAIERIFLALTIPYLFVRGATIKMAPFRIHYTVAWTIGMATLSIWFLPRVLNLALASEAIRRVEIATVLAGGVFFWWPLHSPDKRQRIPMVPNALFYLVAATIWCSLMGLFLAFEQPWYFPRYSTPLDVLHISDSLLRDWSFSRENDQQTAGLLFWISAGVILLSEVMFTYYRWYIAQPRKSPEKISIAERKIPARPLEPRP